MMRPVHVPQRPGRAAQHDQGRPADQLRARGGQRAVQGRMGLLDRPLDARTTARTSSTPSSRSAPTWAARPTGWRASRSSSARATAAASTSPGSTSKGPRPGPWNGSRSPWPTTARSWSTRARSSSKSWAVVRPGQLHRGLSRIARSRSASAGSAARPSIGRLRAESRHAVRTTGTPPGPAPSERL